MVSAVAAVEVAGAVAAVGVVAVAAEADCVGALYLFLKRIVALVAIAAAVAVAVAIASVAAADNCDGTDGVVADRIAGCFPAERTWTAVRGSPCLDCPCCDGAVLCQPCCGIRTAVSGFFQWVVGVPRCPVCRAISPDGSGSLPVHRES